MKSLVVAVLVASSVQAAAPVGSIRVGGGVDVRNSQYEGVQQSNVVTPQLRVDADGWFLPWLGVEVDLLSEFGAKNTSALRYTGGRVGLAVRHHFDNGLSLRAGLGWGGANMPVLMGDVASSITSSGMSARLEAGFETGRFQSSLSGALLIPLLGSQQVFAVEPRVWLGVRMFDVASSHWWAGLDAAALIENSSVYSGVTARVGVGLRVTLDDFNRSNEPSAPPLPLDATVKLRVVLPDGSPAIEARVWVDDSLVGLTSRTGELQLSIAGGGHVIRVHREGLRERREALSLQDGEVRELVVKLETPTGPGHIVGTVFNASTLKPVANARVIADARETRSAVDGTFRVDSVGPGPIRVHVEVPGFVLLEEVAQVPPEGEARLNISLEPVGRGTPAVIRGLVRARTGVALSATVRVQGNNDPVQLDAEGRFELTLPPGSYTLTVSAPGFVAQAKRFDLSAGEQAVFHCELLKI